MTKSAKARKEKRKDFQKPKLKVGKARPKNSNFTDTSFQARRINVLQQSLGQSAPDLTAQFSHHLGLLTHKSDNQRLQSLSHLTSVLQHGPEPLPQPASIIIRKVQPLIRDSSSPVRGQSLKLLRFLPEKDVASHAEELLLWMRLAMTNLSTPIRLSALDAMEWLLSFAGGEMVSCAGGWSKSLKCFAGVLGWDAARPAEEKSKWISASTAGKGTTDPKLLLRCLAVLTSFVETGLLPMAASAKRRVQQEARAAVLAFPLWQSRQHSLPIHLGTTNPFGHLDLFGTPKTDEDGAYEGYDERAAFFDLTWRTSFEDGAGKLAKEGGGIGRAAMGLLKVSKQAREVHSQ